MSATLPSTLASGHEPTGTEFLQILNGLTRITNINLTSSVVTGAWSISSTSSSYADITAGSWSFTKNGDATSSNLMTLFMGGWRATGTAPTSIAIAVQVNGVDTQAGLHECSVAGNLTQHLAFSGACMMTSVPAGAYTMKMRAKRSGGTGTCVIDGTDLWVAVTVEVPL